MAKDTKPQNKQTPAPTAGQVQEQPAAADEQQTANAVVAANNSPVTVTDHDGIVMQAPRKGMTAFVGGMEFEVGDAVTVPVLSLGVSAPVEFAVQLLSLFVESTEEMKGTRKSDGTGGAFSGKPHIIQVLDLSDGVEKQIIAPAVFKSEIEKKWPGGGYVNKYIVARKAAKVGRNYHTFDYIKELRPKASAAQ